MDFNITIDNWQLMKILIRCFYVYMVSTLMWIPCIFSFANNMLMMLIFSLKSQDVRRVLLLNHKLSEIWHKGLDQFLLQTVDSYANVADGILRYVTNLKKFAHVYCYFFVIYAKTDCILIFFKQVSVKTIAHFALLSAK